MGLVSPTGKYYVERAHGMAVDVARNYIVNAVLERGYEWLLFVDSDARLHPLTLVRLLEWQEPIVGALCFTASKPTTPTVYRGWVSEEEVAIPLEEIHEWVVGHRELHTNGPALIQDRPDESLYRVDSTGAHCLLVNRIVFETVPKPWFRVNPRAGRGRGEDVYFFRKLKEHGFTGHVDLSVVAGHEVGRLGVGPLDFLAWYTITDWQNKVPAVR
jgi:hypothetical protein